MVCLILNSGKSSQYSELAQYATDECLKVPGETNLEKSVLRAILKPTKTSNTFNDSSKKILCHFLVEFSTNYVSKKKRMEVEQSSMLTYIRGVQRRLHELALPVN